MAANISNGLPESAPVESPYDPPTNTLRPSSDSVLTIRIIKSLSYRTCKNLLLSHLDLNHMTVGQLKERCLQEVQTKPGWKAYKTAKLDTIKIYTRAHGAKTTNLIINLDDEDWILQDDDQKLKDAGLENETELSFFNHEDYEAFKINPEQKW